MAAGLQRGAATFRLGVSHASGIRSGVEQRHFALHNWRKRWRGPASRQPYGLASLGLPLLSVPQGAHQSLSEGCQGGFASHDRATVVVGVSELLGKDTFPARILKTLSALTTPATLPTVVWRAFGGINTPPTPGRHYRRSSPSNRRPVHRATGTLIEVPTRCDQCLNQLGAR
jgi:hypothetical protein